VRPENDMIFASRDEIGEMCVWSALERIPFAAKDLPQ
jgi:hypothetical protein